MLIQQNAQLVEIIRFTPTTVKVKFLDQKRAVEFPRNFFKRRLQMGLFEVINKAHLVEMNRI